MAYCKERTGVKYGERAILTLILKFQFWNLKFENFTYSIKNWVSYVIL